MGRTMPVRPLQAEDSSTPSVDALMSLHDGDIRSALRRVLGRSQEEDDLVQEVLVRLVIRLRQPGPVCVGAWLRGVAHNLAVDEIRRRRPVPVEQTRLDSSVGFPGDEGLAGVELYSHLVQGARTLPDRQRAALSAVLAADSGPGVAGVADKLGVSLHAAESLLNRARAGMRQHLAASDAGSIRVALGAVLAAVNVGIAWLSRQRRTIAMAGVLAAAAGTVVSLPVHSHTATVPHAVLRNSKISGAGAGEPAAAPIPSDEGDAVPPTPAGGQDQAPDDPAAAQQPDSTEGGTQPTGLTGLHAAVGPLCASVTIQDHPAAVLDTQVDAGGGVTAQAAIATGPCAPMEAQPASSAS